MIVRVFLLLVGGVLSLPAQAFDTITIFAAASTQPVIDALISNPKNHATKPIVVYASSGTLARQIAKGAPADIYITANKQWMDDLIKQHYIEPNSRQNIATNRLVLIAGMPRQKGESISQMLAKGRLAIANPAYVPAGQYAKESLISLGQWDRLKDRVAPTKDVTGALMLVARGEAPLGIVYASDALRRSDVYVVRLFPQTSHSPIVYQAAIIKGHASEKTKQFLAILRGPQGQQAFQNAGFGAAP